MDSLPEVGRPFTLRGDEAHHMLNVVRVRVGEEVCLFDGSGDVAYARLVPASAGKPCSKQHSALLQGKQARRGEAVLEIIGRETIDLEPARSLTLACALPRASRMDFLIEKCTELGLKRLLPMVTQRSVVDPLDRQQNHLERWRRITIEAAKQCGRTRLTEITAALPFEAALLTNETVRTGQDYRIAQDGGEKKGNPVNPVILSRPEPCAARMIASPPAPPGDLSPVALVRRSLGEGGSAKAEAGRSPSEGISLSDFAASLRPDQPVVAFIGPEGGFTSEELDLAARAGCVPVSFGPRILRVETAAIALSAVLLLR